MREQVTIGQFQNFVRSTNYDFPCEYFEGEGMIRKLVSKPWNEMPDSDKPNDPCPLSVKNAIDFAEWLRNGTGKEIWIPTEAEWLGARELVRSSLTMGLKWEHVEVTDIGSNWNSLCSLEVEGFRGGWKEYEKRNNGVRLVERPCVVYENPWLALGDLC
jgi:formylglycine-generating enzyme required for sulfatase activity